jgi:RNA polymerase sigma-70 factor, ECF subfamily
MSVPGEITAILADWRGGNQAALDRLLPLVYDELRRLASGYMRGERSNHLLQTTALVHEAYLRLVDSPNVNYETRAHFFAIAAQVMRHILVDYARGQRRAKRGEGIPALDLGEVAVISDDRAEEIIAVNSALEKLTALDARKSRVFEMRYFGGMSVDEAAEALKLSPATVARDWKMAKAWLRREIAPGLHDAT